MFSVVIRTVSVSVCWQAQYRNAVSDAELAKVRAKVGGVSVEFLQDNIVIGAH